MPDENNRDEYGSLMREYFTKPSNDRRWWQAPPPPMATTTMLPQSYATVFQPSPVVDQEVAAVISVLVENLMKLTGATTISIGDRDLANAMELVVERDYAGSLLVLSIKSDRREPVRARDVLEQPPEAPKNPLQRKIDFE